jgi:hypothetical protein
MTTITQTTAYIGQIAPAAALRRAFETLAALFAPGDREAALSARELRAMADRYEATQPSFAADLRAAAERQQ